MERPKFRHPALLKIQQANRYLAKAGGLEIAPALWIHPTHPHIVVVLPDGSLSTSLDRIEAMRLRRRAWAGWMVPSAFHDQPNWPALSMLLPELPSVNGSNLLPCRPQ